MTCVRFTEGPEHCSLGAFSVFVCNEDLQRDISLRLPVPGQPDCRITTEAEFVDDFITAVAEGVSIDGGMIPSDGVFLKSLQIDLADVHPVEARVVAVFRRKLQRLGGLC